MTQRFWCGARHIGMNTLTRTLTAAVAGLLLAGCATAQGADRPDSESDLVPELTRAIDQAGYEIFHATAGDSDNTVVAPASIGLAFGMADAGATGSVAEALDRAFGFPGEGESRLAAFNTYEQAISIPEGTKGEHPFTGDEVTLPTVVIANRVFTDTDFAPREEYKDLVERWFGAGAQAVPMRSNPDQAAKEMNSWINDRTEGLIQDLYTPESFSDASRLSLLNALYLKAKWHRPMDPQETRTEPFTLLDGSEVDVPMMRASDTTMTTAQGDGYVAAALAYSGHVLEMVVIVPETGQFVEVRERLGTELLDEIDGALVGGESTVLIPRFEADSTIDLGEVMEQSLGWDGIFQVVGLDTIGDQLMIGSAVHATKIIVDEEGTEAAAVTAIDVEVASAPPEPALEVIADKPFLYVIRDVDTGAALFVGQVLDPTLDDERSDT